MTLIAPRRDKSLYPASKLLLCNLSVIDHGAGFISHPLSTAFYLIWHHRKVVQVADATLTMARYKKSIINSLWVHKTLVTCYVPIAEVTALILILGLNLFLLVALASAVASVNLNSLLNPIIYRWKIKEVRRTVI